MTTPTPEDVHDVRRRLEKAKEADVGLHNPWKAVYARDVSLLLRLIDKEP